MYKIGEQVIFNSPLMGTDEHIINKHLWNTGRIVNTIGDAVELQFTDGTAYWLNVSEVMYTEEQRTLNAAQEIAELIISKHKSYGGASDKTGDILKLLYPNGIKVEQYDTINHIARILDKLGRIASGNKGAFEENPWNDLVGYALRAKLKEEA